MAQEHGDVVQKEEWQDRDQHLAERLDWYQARGSGSASEQQLAWSLFTELSPYSPVRLDQETGWRPTPNDLPAHCDPRSFGWTDAFEDLLAASSARPMMSLERRELMNDVLRNSPLAWKPSWLLYNRLVWQGLDEAYFPMYIPHRRYRSPRTMEEWVALRKTQTFPTDNWERSSLNFLTRDVGTIDSGLIPSALSSWFQGVDGGFSPQLLHKLLDEILSPPREEGASAETEEDLYLSSSTMNHPDHAAPGPLTSLFRIIGKAVFHDEEVRSKTATTAHNGDGAGAGEEEVEVERTAYETQGGGREEVIKLVRELPGGDRINTVRIVRADEHGAPISVEVHSRRTSTPEDFDSPYWKKFWKNAHARGVLVGEKKPISTQEKKKESE